MSSYLLVAIAGGGSCFRIHAPENGILAEHAVQGFLNDAEKFLTATLAGWSGCAKTASKKGDESLLQQFYQKRLGLPRNEFTEDFFNRAELVRVPYG